MNQTQDNYLATPMTNEAHTARNLPVRSPRAEFLKEYPTLSTLWDTTEWKGGFAI
jgi:hypothetical protein